MTNEVSQTSMPLLLEIMAKLRDPALGCPWDLEQTFATIAPHTLEETYEVLDAIACGDHQQLCAELGDLLFQVVFYARLGQEQSLFSFADVTEQISAKLLRRHPHVFPQGTLESFGEPAALDSANIALQWEAIKAEERSESEADKSILADVPKALTALMRAMKLQKRVARHGMDWQNHQQVEEKLAEELQELRDAMEKQDSMAINEEFGDILFTVVNLGRHLGLDAETSLREANTKFEARIRGMESLLDAEGKTMTALDASELDSYWERSKKTLSKG